MNIQLVAGGLAPWVLIVGLGLVWGVPGVLVAIAVLVLAGGAAFLALERHKRRTRKHVGHYRRRPFSGGREPAQQ